MGGGGAGRALLPSPSALGSVESSLFLRVLGEVAGGGQPTALSVPSSLGWGIRGLLCIEGVRRRLGALGAGVLTHGRPEAEHCCRQLPKWI